MWLSFGWRLKSPQSFKKITYFCLEVLPGWQYCKKCLNLNEIKSTTENTTSFSSQKYFGVGCSWNIMETICALCLPENYIDVPQDGRGKTRLQGAAFKKINWITRAEKIMGKEERERLQEGDWASHLKTDTIQTTSTGKWYRKSLQDKVVCKQYFNSRLTLLSLKGSIISEKMLSRKKIKLLWQIHAKVENDHKTNLW